MGRKDFSKVYTDCSEHAGWRPTDWNARLPWFQEPSYAAMDGFSLRMLRIDWMHTWHLGVCRDLLGAGLRLMVSNKQFFPGSNISIRLKQLLRAVKQFAKANGKQVSLKNLTKNTLSWGNQCPEFKSSAADSGVFLQWTSQKLQEQSLEEPWAGVSGVAFCADKLCDILMGSGVFLTSAEEAQARILGQLFIRGYIALAGTAFRAHRLLFKVRPKFHYLCHMLDDMNLRNPTWDACWMDEDFVKYGIRMYRKMNHSTAGLNILKRNLIMLKHSLKQHVL